VTESVALPIETWAVTSEQLPVTNKQIIVNSVIAGLIRSDDDVIAEQIRTNDDVIPDVIRTNDDVIADVIRANDDVIAEQIRTDDGVIAGLTRNPIRTLLKLLFFICL
jgi:hypothetical protein